MPLVIFSGGPSTGKTTLALRLKSEIEKKMKEDESVRSTIKRVVLINEETLGLSRAQGYKNSAAEKMHRGAFKAAVHRAISKDTVVLADSLNYIKGFRYELFCLCREAGTSHAVVYCDTPREEAEKRNQARPIEAEEGEGEEEEEKKEGEGEEGEKMPSFGYSPSLFDDIWRRMERPDGKNRWDSPLFDAKNGEEMDVDAFLASVLFGKQLKPTCATSQVNLSGANMLSELDRRTQEIVDALIETTSLSGGGLTTVPHTKEKVLMPSDFNATSLRKLRRQFLRFQKSSPPKTVTAIGDLFVSFLNTSLN